VFLRIQGTVNLSEVIEGLVEERGLDKEKIINIVCEGIQTAYARKFPSVQISTSFNRKTGDLEVFAEKTVVTSVTDEDKEVSLRKAKLVNPQAQIDQTVKMPFEDGVGRIEILVAKQIIASKIRDLEQMAIFNDFNDKRGTIINGVIHKRERAGYVIKIGEVMALLPKENTIPNEIIKMGHPIRALLKEVLSVARGDYQLILDRASAEFVQKLLELEIPEVFEQLVEIKKIVRVPGYKTKAIVASSSKEIDPVGTCVGVGGSRIKPILKELGQEKIDLIESTDVMETLVRFSLKPAEIDKVEIVDERTAVVWLSQDQRSYAIGKMGQNIMLASKLVDLDIQLQDIAPANKEMTLYTDDTEEDKS
jgi:transcription termination/antitermination protein NusA